MERETARETIDQRPQPRWRLRESRTSGADELASIKVKGPWKTRHGGSSCPPPLVARKGSEDSQQRALAEALGLELPEGLNNHERRRETFHHGRHDLGLRVDMVERNHDAQVQELDHQRQELLTLHDSNRVLQYRLEDHENRSRCSNICIRGVPAQATPGSLEDFVIRLFWHIKDQEKILDRTHRAGHPSRAPGPAQDILACLHCYKQKKQILASVRDLNARHFDSHKIYLYLDLSPRMLQCR
ncbi:hypothetical protein NDU88_002222 [Pleurodeles waltl]|uniref:Uncharacterized protein n=1 Tax=Pleurodeles waltl TaxID=8319 RepID=A0AAV7VBX9_PLEWA|nr:hypothetical protein NDU88_002222 [Pleurodeles waltl]